MKFWQIISNALTGHFQMAWFWRQNCSACESLHVWDPWAWTEDIRQSPAAFSPPAPARTVLWSNGQRFSPYYPCQMTLCHMRDPGLWLSILRYQVCLINFWYDKLRWEYTYFLHRERWQRDPTHVYLWSAKSCRVVIKDRIVTELFRNFYNDLLHLNILLSRCNMGIGRVIKARWQDGPALASNPPKQ